MGDHSASSPPLGHVWVKNTLGGRGLKCEKMELTIDSSHLFNIALKSSPRSLGLFRIMQFFPRKLQNLIDICPCQFHPFIRNTEKYRGSQKSVPVLNLSNSKNT